MFELRFFIAPLAALLIGLSAVWAIRRIATSIGFVDNPDRHRKLHEMPVPLGGGIGVWLATWLAWVISLYGSPLEDQSSPDSSWFYTSLAISSLIVLGLGVIDDRYGLRARHKLAGQIVAAMILVGYGLRVDIMSCFGIEISLGIFAYPLTVLWILLIVNAFNLIDGMDGFCGSLGLVASLAIAFLSYRSGRFHDMLIGLALAGGLAAFLRDNLPPAKVYLGDAGSMSIGLLISALSIRACSNQFTSTLSIARLIALLSLPLLDVLAALGRRWLTGRSIFTPDRGHLHHRLKNRFTYPYLVLGVAIGLAVLGAGSAAVSKVYNTGDGLVFLAVFLSVALLVFSKTFGGSELRLLVFHLQRLVTTQLNGNAAQKTGLRQECHIHGIRDWGGVWNNLLQEGEADGVWRIELSIDMASTGEVYHGLWSSHSRSEDGPNWSVVHSLYVRGVPAGILSVAGGVDANRTQYLGKVEKLVKVVQTELEMEVSPSLATTTSSISTVNRPVTVPVT